jgi:hypothetical protein
MPAVCSLSTRDTEGPGDCGSEVFTAERTERVEDSMSGDTTVVNVQTLFEAFLEGFQTLNYFPQLLKYQEFQSNSIRIKEILPY